MSQQHYVNYTINGKDYQAGPYQSQAEADMHHQDIRSYAGITNCWISNTRDEKRILMGSSS